PALAARTIPIRPSALRPVGRADRARVHGPETPGPSRRVRFTVPEPPACLPAERLPARSRFRGHRCFPCRTTGGAFMSFVKAPRFGLGWFGLWGSCGEFDVLGDSGFVEGAVSEHGEQDADALAGQAEEGLGVGFAAGSLLVVVGAGG